MALSLWQLCFKGNLVGVRAALARGEDVNSRDADDNTGLMYAISRGHNEIVKFLVEQPTVDLNCTSREGNTALHIAADVDNVEVVRMLLDDARLNTANHKNNDGDTPVMTAMITHSLNALRELVAHPSVDLDILPGGMSLEEFARRR